MGPAKYGKTLLRSMLTARRINRELELPGPLRSEVARTFLRLSRVQSLQAPVSFMGYEVLYQGEKEFRFLFNEIFVEASYNFRADGDCPLIFDCGSNIGMSILFFKKLYPNARIVGFEPDPLSFDTLKANVERNALSNVTVHRYALSDRDDTKTFYRAAEDSRSELTMSLLKERNDGVELTVKCHRLSPFVVEEIDLLKIDVEGAEHQVLLELAGSGKLRLIKQIHLEYHHHIDSKSDTLSMTLRLLEEEGFGYQMKASSSRWPTPCFQDISIYCYRKH